MGLSSATSRGNWTISRSVATTDKTLTDLADSEQHEALLEIFGEHVFWARNSVLTSIEGLVTSEEKRERLVKLFREPFDRTASLGDEERRIAIEILRSAAESVGESRSLRTFRG